MSTIGLYRMVVRLSHDPAFVLLLRIDPNAACVGTGLTDEERLWLSRVDPKAFGVDEHVRRRTLDALAKTVDVPVALTMLAGDGNLLFEFFSSGFFHRAIQSGLSLSTAFCDYLAASTREGRIKDARIAPVAQLYRMMTEVMFAHASTSRPESGAIAISPHVRLGMFPEGIIELITAVKSYLSKKGDVWGDEDDEANKLIDEYTLNDNSIRPVLIERGAVAAQAIQTSYVHDLIAELLSAARRPGCTYETLLGHARELGLVSPHDHEVIKQLLVDGLIIEGS